MLVNKFNYIDLEQINTPTGRLYKTPQNEKVPSVTTILGATADKTWLIEWRKSIGETRANQITTEAGNRGTRIHNYLEKYFLTDEWPEPGSNPFAKQANKMAKIIKDNIEHDIEEIYGSEVRLYFPGIYAGTTDLVAKYKGNLCICDFKQSNRRKKREDVTDYFLQLSSYIEAHNEMYGTDINEGHVFMSTVDCEFIHFELTPEDFAHYKKMWWERCEQFYLINNT